MTNRYQVSNAIANQTSITTPQQLFTGDTTVNVVNNFYGSKFADYVTFSNASSTSFSVANITTGDTFVLSGVDASNVKVKHLGNSVVMSTSTQTYTFGAVAAGESFTVKFGTGSDLTLTRTGLDTGLAITREYGSGVVPSAVTTSDSGFAPPSAPSAPTLTPIGGTVISNALNDSNVYLTATAIITAGQATGGSAVLKLAGVTIATDSSILAGDTQLDFSTSDGSPTATELKQKISAGGNVTVELTDAAGNTSAASPASVLTVDYTAPTQTISAVHINADTSVTTDFITKTAAQTITATLSGGLLEGEKLYGRVIDSGAWTDVTSKVSSTTSVSWDGASLSSGNKSIQLKITDAAGNDSAITSQPYTLDTTAPTTATFSLADDSGNSSSDKISKTGTVNVTGLESGLAWEYSVNDGAAWSDGSGTGTTGTFTLTANTTNQVKIRQIDTAGNEAVTASAVTMTIDTTAPTAPTVAANSAVKPAGIFATGLTLGTNEVLWLAPSGTTTFTANSTTITTSTSASITAPTTENLETGYNLFLQDAAGNISSASSVAVLVDNTKPTTTITGVKFIQQYGSDSNVIRLTGTNFNGVLTGTANASTDVTARLDWTKFGWNVGGATQLITTNDILKTNVISATQLDIVLNPSNALYNNSKFLTSLTTNDIADTLVVTAGFIKDKAGNAATTDGLASATVDVTTAYPLTLSTTAANNKPTVYVPTINLTAPATGDTTFSGENVKSKATITLSTATTAAGTVTVEKLTGSTFSVSDSSAKPIATNFISTGGGSLVTLGNGSDIVTIGTLTITSPDTVDVGGFTSGTDKVYFKYSIFSALASSSPSSATAIDTNKIFSGVDTPTGSGKNIWIATDSDGNPLSIYYDADGVWSTGSVVLISIPDAQASDFYLIA